MEVCHICPNNICFYKVDQCVILSYYPILTKVNIIQVQNYSKVNFDNLTSLNHKIVYQLKYTFFFSVYSFRKPPFP